MTKAHTEARSASHSAITRDTARRGATYQSRLGAFRARGRWIVLAWIHRTEAAKMLGMASRATLDRTASDMSYGRQMDARGLLPFAYTHPVDGRPAYLLDDVLAVIERRSDPAIAKRLRARQIKSIFPRRLAVRPSEVVCGKLRPDGLCANRFGVRFGAWFLCPTSPAAWAFSSLRVAGIGLATAAAAGVSPRGNLLSPARP